MSSEHLQAFRNGRGYALMPRIHGASGGHVQVYDSSSNGVPYVWVKINNGRADPVHVRLSAESAWHLSQQIQTLLEEHPQGVDALPETVRREIAHKYREEVADEHP